MARKRRALGLIRVSEVGDREADRFGSPDEQLECIERACNREGIELIDTFREINVSGGALLAKRPGLTRALEEVEAGHAEVIAVAYFDRLFRSLKVQHEVAERIERAGGALLAADYGEIGGGSAARWMSATVLGMMSEYTRRSIGERTASAQRRAVVEHGRPPHPLIPGYRRAADGSVELDPSTAPVVHRAFEMRAEGHSLRQIRAFLGENGIRRSSLTSAHMMFRNRMVLGEIRWGKYTNVCPRLVDDQLWDRVQRTVGAPRGRYAKSERLLARTGVLRCGACGGRMSATTKTTSRSAYPFYRCAAVDCHSATVGAEKVEKMVVAEVKRMAGSVRERASATTRAEAAAADAKQAQAALDNAIAAFERAGLETEPSAVTRLAELREARDAAIDVERETNDCVSALEVSLGKNWDDLSLAGRRGLVRALIEHVSVTPGNTPDRVTIKTREILL